MKPCWSKIAVVVCSLAALCLPTAKAWGRLPPPNQAKGVIRVIDHEVRVFTIQPSDGKAKPFLLCWDKRTDFVTDGKLVPASALQPGTTVHLYYRRPTFGNPYVVKAIWATEANNPTKPPKEEHEKD